MSGNSHPDRPVTRLADAIATVGFVGRLHPAPGTWGSLAAFPLAYLLWLVGGLWLLLLAIPVGFVAGWWATREATRGHANHDPSEIVIDEVVGQWIALVPVALGTAVTGASPLAMWPGLLAAFVFFRVFDILKPGPVGLADRREDALGVMLDDVVAGALASMCVLVLAVVAHAVMGA